MKSIAPLAALLSLAAVSGPAERIVTGDGVVVATIDGAPGRLRIDPAAPGMPIVSADWAMRAGLKPGMFGIAYGIGRTMIGGRTAVARIDVGAGPDKHRVGWTAQPYAAVVDGVVGPGGLPEPIVRFMLRPAQPGERTAVLPMVDGGGLFGGFGGLFTTLDIDGQPIRVRFDPWHARTLATAGAAQRIAAARDGRLSGDAAPVEIAFGVERPVRTMMLARPIAIGPLNILTLGVRTSDFGTAGAIPEAGAQPDPDEIIVTAKGKRNRDRRHDKVSIGRDQLDRCSSIVFDKPKKQIRLTCE